MITALAALALGHALRSSLTPQQVDAKADALISQMTLDEKISMLGGVDGFFTHPIERLGIPRFRMSDGPLGLRNQGPSTAYPAGVTLGASWDPSLAHDFGTAIGTDARARGVHYWLGPGVDLDRIPENGRNFEYLGENPLLSADMAVQIIQGVQAQGVAATVKHYACNDNENDRQTDDSIVDERTLHELELVPFEAAVKQGHVWALMDGYNLVNGEHDAQNKVLLTDILKDQWGFQGVVMSDWGATHNGVDSFNAGQDLEMPGPDFMNAKNLKAGLQSGALSMNLLNDKIRRQLRTAISLGWLDRDQVSGEPWVQPKNDAVALKIASEGTTLLKNESSFLPLKKSGTIVVIGPNAQPPVTNGGGSSFVQPHAETGLIDAMKQAAPDAQIIQIPFQAPSKYEVDGTVTSEGQPGWKTSFYKGKDLKGKPVSVSQSPGIAFKWTGHAPIQGLGQYNYSVRLEGTFTPSKSGSCVVRGRSDDGMKVTINGKTVISMWQDQGASDDAVMYDFQKGKAYRIVVEYYQAEGDAVLDFGIENPAADLLTPSQEDQIRSADVVIAAVGFNPSLESEGRDRTWALPLRQQLLLHRAEQLNSHVAMILNAGGAVDIAPFVPSAKAVIDSYYPGENGDIAVAKILFGDLNPSGHLPFVIPVKESDLLSYGTYPAKNHKIPYKEGVFNGQRGLDKQKIAALYPFGFGLSYTSFTDWSLAGTVSSVLGRADSVTLSGSFKNSGSMDGSNVVQVYVQFPKAKEARPLYQLVGFQRVSASAGESGQFEIKIPISKLGWWDPKIHDWRVDPGTYRFVISDQAPTFKNHFYAQFACTLSKSDADAITASEKP